MIGRKLPVAPRGDDCTSVDVDYVGNCLKREERDSDRQRNKGCRRQWMKPDARHNVSSDIPEERRIFVIYEAKKIDRNPSYQKELSVRFGRPLHANRKKLVHP